MALAILGAQQPWQHGVLVEGDLEGAGEAAARIPKVRAQLDSTPTQRVHTSAAGSESAASSSRSDRPMSGETKRVRAAGPRPWPPPPAATA